MKKIKKLYIKEPRPTEPNLLLNILELSDKVNELVDAHNKEIKLVEELNKHKGDK